jgi:hypothetical protein
MDAGLWLDGLIVPVSRVVARAHIQDCAAQVTISFSYVCYSSSTDTLFKAHVNPSLGCLSGCVVAVDAKEVVGSFLASDKATDLFGKDNINTQNTPSWEEEDILVCKIGAVGANTRITVSISFVTELSLSPTADSLRFILPAINWMETAKGEDHEVDVEVTVTMGTEATLASPSHPNSSITTQEGKHTTLVRLASTSATAESGEDFVLDITPTSSYSSCVVERYSKESVDDKYAVFISLFKKGITPSFPSTPTIHHSHYWPCL